MMKPGVENRVSRYTSCSTIQREQTYNGFLEVFQKETMPDFRAMLAALAHSASVDRLASVPDLVFEKYHRFLTKDVLKIDVLSLRLAADALPETCARILTVLSA